MAQISVTINGRTFRMACDDGQEAHVSALADRLDREISDLQTNFGAIGDVRLTVMAAIKIADDLATCQRDIAALKGQIASMRESQAAVFDGYALSENLICERLEECARQIELLADRLVKKSGDAGPVSV